MFRESKSNGDSHMVSQPRSIVTCAMLIGLFNQFCVASGILTNDPLPHNAICIIDTKKVNHMCGSFGLGFRILNMRFGSAYVNEEDRMGIFTISIKFLQI